MSPQAHIFFWKWIMAEEKHDKIFEILTQSNDITWQSLIMDLVKSEGMDPWDVDIGILTNKYITTLRKLKEHDFRVSGKVLLASAILLKIKSTKLMGEDMNALDSLFASTEEIDEQAFYNDLEQEMHYINTQRSDRQKYPLIPRTPQMRKRKVSIYDLVGALEKALEVKRRRVMRDIPESKITLPRESVDISLVIKQIHSKILNFFYKNKKKKLAFSTLLPSSDKEAKIRTFIPLLHLATNHKIDLNQEEHFGEIEVLLKNKTNKEE